MQGDHGEVHARLAEWRRHLRALVPRDADDGVVVVRASLIEWLVEDLERADAVLDSYEELADVVRHTLSEWSGSVEALRAITDALDRVETEREITRE